MKKKKTRIRSKDKWWTRGLGPVDVGEKLRLVPYWEPRTGGRVELVVDPGPSFGVGDHPSTIMALQFLEAVIAIPPAAGYQLTMLDVGTGTGVLAIAGKALGTGFTVALDIDAASVFSARRNFTLNNIGYSRMADEGIELVVGSAECLRCPFDIVVANLAAPLLLRCSGLLSELAGRFLILSGIAEVLSETVVRAYRGANMQLLKETEQKGWHALLLQQQPESANTNARSKE